MPVGADGAFHYTSYSGYKGALENDWKHEDAETRGKEQSKYHGLRLYDETWGGYSWSAVLYPPPGQVGRVERHFTWSSLRSPLIILHKLPGEVEAALAKDLLDLWYGLSQGWSQAKLAAHNWNIPQMKLWAEPKLVQILGRIGPEDYNKAQTRVRSLMSKWLPQVPKEVVKEGKKAVAAREKAQLNFFRKLDARVKKAKEKRDEEEGEGEEEEEERKPARKSKAAQGTSAEGGARKRARVPQGPAMTPRPVERAEASQARVKRAARRKAQAEQAAKQAAKQAEQAAKRGARAVRAARRAARSGK